jgi:hypothetical protein
MMQDDNNQPPEDEIKNETDPEEGQLSEEAIRSQAERRAAIREWIIAGSIFLILAVMIWWNFPIVDQLVRGRYTPTARPPLPTPTYRATRTPTPIATDTITPTPSRTPLPPSAHLVTDTAGLEPPLPALVNPPIVLDDDSVTPSPDFSNPVWVPSSKLNLPNVDLKNPYYASEAPGAATWMMDSPLAPGYYEIYVLDTLYSSAGSLDFRVSTGDTDLSPLLGSSTLVYRSSQGNDAQDDDLWRSIGVYYLDKPGVLSVKTAWDKRDASTIVAIARLLIEPMQDSTLDMVARLPKYPLRYVIDDMAAKITGADTTITAKDSEAWQDQFQAIVNPQSDLKVVWETDFIPSGIYEIAVWVPATHNQTKAALKVLVNGTEMKGGPLVMKQSDWHGGQWVSLGTWDSTSYGKYVEMGVEMDVTGGTPGDVAVDAVAFMTKPIPPTPVP